MINVVVGTHLGGSDEAIPVETFRDGLCVCRNIESLRPERTVGSAVNASYLADFSVPYPVAYEIGVSC